MGKMLGAFDPDDELDRPDLNKCPDCGCFFAQSNCPLCGKVCPEEMRAGNRKAVRKKKPRRGSSGRVTFIDWYHSWWFIILMLFVFPIVGIVLLVTSPHKKSVKITVAVLGILYAILSTVGVGNVIYYVRELLDQPVDTSLSREEYIEACETVSAEDYYRSAEAYEDRFVSVTVTVTEKALEETFSSGEREVYYVCRDENGGSFEILVRDCFQGEGLNLLVGDVITVYGEGAKVHTVYDGTYQAHTAPCINGAYVELHKSK
ncbi:MAG: hypothetical protein IJY47_04265 [Clostridia bacterium]|nr:hypothetical protein [Clostridia bacterium]